MIKISHLMNRVRLKRTICIMLRCKVNYSYYIWIFVIFFIWAPLLNINVANTLLVRVQRDADFISEMIKELKGCFFTILLPEIVTRRNYNKQKNYCICNRPCFKPMIACDRPNCKVDWYHYAYDLSTMFSRSIYS